ncbi:hypothetical protein [Stappia sp. ES.058]|uniref:hypothetical protein n=1 Tax=Stappia sp. ES.058 TaxID=1881061 RepID=UPI00087A2932|nr:hypothetical protein [Stappia sp. ES.058]SDU44670.1 hypothetical protein SAMN05428979_3902 [Stappia sp. ES.058]
MIAATSTSPNGISQADGQTQRLGRLWIYSDGIGTLIEIPSRRLAPVVVFLAIWLVGWSFAGFISVSAFFGSFGGPAVFTVFIGVWCSVWAGGWVATAASLLWMLVGREIAILRDGVLTKRLVLPWVGLSRSYSAEFIRDLRLNTMTGDPQISQEEGVGLPLGQYGAVAFDHDGETVYLGAALGPMAADALLEAIEAWLQQETRDA